MNAVSAVTGAPLIEIRPYPREKEIGAVADVFDFDTPRYSIDKKLVRVFDKW
jgi:hypothetical protein